MSSLTQKEIDEYEKFWKNADKNKDGSLTIQELKRELKTNYKGDITDAEVAGMFCDIDKDGDARMTKQEFMTAMTQKKKRAQAMMDLFKKYDKDRSNTLSRGEVIQMVRDNYTEDRVNFIVGQFLSFSDFNADGQVTLEEFSRYFG